MASERLPARALPDVPQLGCEVTRPRDEEPEVWGHGQGHAVSLMSRKDGLLGSSFNVPQDAEGEQGQVKGQTCRCVENLRPLTPHPPTTVRDSDQVQSPELVMISVSLRKRQQDR